MSHTPEHITTAPVVPVQEGIQAGIGGFSVPTSAPASITADDLTSTATPIAPVFPPQEGIPNLTGGQATIDALNKLLGGADSAPASLESMFTKLLPASGVPEAQQDVLAKQTTSKVARDKLAAINAQLAGISAEVQAAPIRLQEEATGRGVTKAGLAPLEAGELRKIALRALPLQAQALAAQAEVAAAQGDVELSQQTLAMAQDKLKTIFGLVSQDVENKYNYFKDLRDKAFQIADKNQQQNLAAAQKEDDRKFTNWQNIINDAQTKASDLMSTDPALAAKISARIGQSSGLNDTTLGGDVAALLKQALLKQVRPKVETKSTALLSEDRRNLIGVNLNDEMIFNIEEGVRTIGIDKVLKDDYTDAQKAAIKKVYGIESKEVTQAQLLQAAQAMNAADVEDFFTSRYTEDEINKFAKDAGFAGLFKTRATERANYFTSSKARKKLAELLGKQYEQRGFTIK